MAFGKFEFSGVDDLYLSEEKKLENKAARKKAALPIFSKKATLVSAVDGDTFNILEAEKNLRLSGGINTAESTETGLSNNKILRSQQRSYGAKYGVPWETVTKATIKQEGLDAKKAALGALGGEGSDIQYVEKGVDRYGRTLADVYSSDGDNLADTLSGRNANNQFDSATAKGKYTGEVGTGFDDKGSPEIQIGSDGLFVYGDHQHLTRSDLEKNRELYDADFAYKYSWDAKLGSGIAGQVADVAGMLYSGTGMVKDIFEKGILSGFTPGNTLEDSFNTWNNIPHVASGKTKAGVIGNNERVMFDSIVNAETLTDEQEEFIGSPTGRNMLRIATEYREKREEFKEIGENAEDRSSVVDRRKSVAVNKEFIEKYEDEGLGSALLFGLKNAPHFGYKMVESLPLMVPLATPGVSVVTMAAMSEGGTMDGVEEFRLTNGSEPNEKEVNTIAGWKAASALFEKFGADRAFAGNTTFIKQFLKSAGELEKPLRFLAKGAESLFSEGASGGGSEFSDQMAITQDVSNVDYGKVALGATEEALGALGISASSGLVRGVKKIKPTKAIDNKIEDATPTPQASPSTYTPTEGIGGAETQTILANSIAVLTGNASGDKNQAVFDLLSTLQNADELFGDTAQAAKDGMAGLIKDNAKEIFAASEELSKLKDVTEKEFNVVLGSLGSGDKVDISKIDGLSEQEIKAVEAINSAIDSSGTKEMQRVSGEIIDPSTPNASIKGYLQGALDTGSIAAGFTNFNIHMQAKANAFIEAFNSGTVSYIKKGMNDYTIHTEVPSDAVKEDKGTGYKNYFVIHGNSKRFVEGVESDVKLISEYYELAEAVVDGKASRGETVKVANDLGREIIKSGALDKGDIGGKVEEEKVEGEVKKEAKEAGKKADGTVDSAPDTVTTNVDQKKRVKVIKQLASVLGSGNGKWNTEKYAQLFHKTGNKKTINVKTLSDFDNEIITTKAQATEFESKISGKKYYLVYVGNIEDAGGPIQAYDSNFIEIERSTTYNKTLASIATVAEHDSAQMVVDSLNEKTTTKQPTTKPVAKPQGDSERLGQPESIPIPVEEEGGIDSDRFDEDTIPTESMSPSESIDELTDNYNSSKVVRTKDKIIAKDGKTEIVAKNIDGVIFISTNKALWKKYFAEKRWTKPREQKDGSFAEALPEDIFKSENELEAFVLAHEEAHNVVFKKPDETIGEYERRVNDYAIKELGFGYRADKSNWFDKVKSNLVNIGREYTTTLGELITHKLPTKDSFLSGTSLKILSSETEKNAEIERLTAEFKAAGDKYIDPDSDKQDLIYSFNNLMVRSGNTQVTPDEFYYAMANAFANWMAASGRKTLINDAHDMSMILYGEWDHALLGNDAIIHDKGTPLYMVAEGAGGNMSKILGLKVAVPKGMSRQDKAMLGRLSDQKSFDKTLGLMMLDLAGRLESNPVTVVKNATYDLGKASKATRKSKDNTIQLSTIKINKDTKQADKVIDGFSNSDQYFEDINGVQIDKSDIYTDKPKETVSKRIQGSMSDLPANRQTLLRKLQDVVWKPIEGNISTFLSFDPSHQRIIAGWVDRNSVHVDKRKAVDARNNQIDKHIQDLKDLSAKKFFFGYYFMNQFRIMIDSNGINPLSGKNLHRFMVNNDKTKVVFKKGDATEVMFKYSIVQALGSDVDKTDHAGVLEDFNSVVGEFGELAQNITGKELVDRGVNAHGLAGLVALGDWLNVDTGEEVTSHLGLEVDGITNGYALGLLQFPNDEDGGLEANLKRVGITYKKGEYEKGIHGVEDAYNRAGRQFKKVLTGNGLIDVFEGVYGGIDRNLMKGPFMIFNYGASAHKATEGIAKAISSKIYKGEVSADELRVFVNTINPRGMYKINNLIAALDKKSFMETDVSDDIVELEGMIQRGFSGIVEEAFEPLVGSTKEIKDQLTKAMDAIASGFAVEFEERSKELVGELVINGPKHPELLPSGKKNKKAGTPIRLSKDGLNQVELRQVAEGLLDTHYPLLAGGWNNSSEGEKQAFIDMVSRDKIQTDKRVQNFMLTEADNKAVRDKLATMVSEYSDSLTKAKNIAKLVNSSGGKTTWDAIKRNPKLKVDGKLNFDKVAELLGEGGTTQTTSGVSLGGFAYGHPGAKMLVRSIQNMDASIMGKTMQDSDSFLGLHDAVYVGIDKIQETVKRINSNALELSKDYSIAEAVLEQFIKVKGNIEKNDHRLTVKLSKKYGEDKLYEVKALIDQANSRLDDQRAEKTKTESFGGDTSKIDLRMQSIVDGLANELGITNPEAISLLDTDLGKIDIGANLRAWDKHYADPTNKEAKDAKNPKKPKAKLVPPSQKLGPLEETVSKNNEDRKILFDKLKSGEVVQYYMPDSTSNKDIQLGSLGSESTQDIKQDAVVEVLRGNATAENIEQVNEMLGADNKDINKVLKELVQPLVWKIDSLVINIKGYASGVYAEGLFRSADNAIEVVYNIDGPVSRTEQTAQEVFAHEMIHAVSWRAVQGSLHFRNELTALRDAISKNVSVRDFLVDGDTSEDAKKLAERQYLAVFGKDSLQEFLAYGLTNPVLIQKLKGTKSVGVKWFAGDTWYEKVLSAMVKAMSIVEGFINKKDNKNAHEQLFSLAQEVNGINQSKASKIANTINAGKVYEKSDELIKSFVGKHERFARTLITHAAIKGLKISHAGARVFPKFNGVVGSKLTLAGQIATLSPGIIARMMIQLFGKGIIYTTKNGDKVTLYTKDKDGNIIDPGKALTYSLAEMAKKMEGNAARELFKLITDVTGTMPVVLQRSLSESKRKVEQARDSAKELVGTVLNKSFGDRKPSKEESRMLTKAIGKTDLQLLRDVYSDDVVATLIKSKSKLDALINSEKKALGLNGWWYKQAEGLSTRMVKQEQGGHLVFDNVKAMVKNADSEISDVDRFDRFVTLLALSKTDGRESLASFIDSNKDGFTEVINTFVSLASVSKESFVGSEMLMTKGYVPKVGDAHRAVEVAGLDRITKEQMKLKGYDWQYDLVNYAGEQVGMYLAKNLPLENQVKGLLSRTGKHMAHTSMMEKWKEDYSDKVDSGSRNYKDLKKYQALMLNKEMGTVRTGKALRPVVDEKGKIVDLTIDMNFDVEEDLLGLNMDVVEVTSTLNMNIIDKINSEEVNEEGIDTLIGRQEDHRPGNEWEFINIMDTKSDDYQELFIRLPWAARKKIEKYAKLNGGDFWVEEVWLDAIFGYENWSIANLVKGESRKRKVKIVEEVVKGIVGVINNNIVIKTPAVWGGNFASNFITSVISGLGAFETIKYWKDGLDKLKEYQKYASEIAEIDFKSRANVAYKKANVARRKLLTDRMNKSSVAELMDAGLYSAITTQEMQTDEYSYKNKAVRVIEEATGKLKGGTTVGKIVKGLYLAEDTEAYKSLLGMVQVSDFLGRYGIYRKMVDDQGKTKDEAYKYIQDVFVDFNIPIGKVAQYANSMGMMLFYKYWSRIQRATLGMIKHHPTKSMQTLLMRSVLGMDMGSIFNSGIITGGNFSPTHGWIDPIKMLKQFVMPSGLEIGIGIGGGEGVTGVLGALGAGAATVEGAIKNNQLHGFHYGSSDKAGN